MPVSRESVPVLVWGGGCGGAAAALQAARSGAPTLLLTPGPWLGGMVSAAGVCAPDGNELTPWQTGLWGALLRALAAAEPTGLDHNWVSCFGFRPATAEAVLRSWVHAEARLRWWPNCTLEALEHHGERVGAVCVRQGDMEHVLMPELLIDGSDLGDLLGLGAADFRLGWESQEMWNEPSAPSAEALLKDPFFRSQPVQSPTWVAMARFDAERPLPPCSGDLPHPFAGAISRYGLERTLNYGRLPGDLLMLNWPIVGNDWHLDLPGLFGGTPGQQREHLQQLEGPMQAHSLAFAAALSEASGGVVQPASVFPALGTQADDLQGDSALALMPYWREGRRLLGLETVIEQDLLPLAGGASRAPLPGRDGRCTSIAVGNYANDHHYPGDDWPLASKSCRWGGRWTGTPFCVPFGALVSATTSNLLAADKCLSVSHIANGATRLQPLVLNIGQAAGMAAALCHRYRCLPADLPVSVLQEELIAEPTAPAAPFPLWSTPWHHPDWAQHQRAILRDPGSLSEQGMLTTPGQHGVERVIHQAPPERHEHLVVGTLRGSFEEGYRLESASQSWPLITLEPAMHTLLQDTPAGTPLRLIGCPNRWGPWLRVTRSTT